MTGVSQYLMTGCNNMEWLPNKIENLSYVMISQI